MNLILLQPSDLLDERTARIVGRRLAHIREVHRAALGDTLRVGLECGRIGTGRVRALSAEYVELELSLTEYPPAPMPIVLLLALPRPKAFRRVLQCAVTMGVKRIALFGAWRVEKSYWQSPWLAGPDLLAQVGLALEQARDTIPPLITTHPLFKPFIEDIVPGLSNGCRCLVAHPGVNIPCPCALAQPVCLAIGPEGGFTDFELGLLANAGFEQVCLGPRILRTEQAVPAMLGRLMPAPLT